MGGDGSGYVVDTRTWKETYRLDTGRARAAPLYGCAYLGSTKLLEMEMKKEKESENEVTVSDSSIYTDKEFIVTWSATGELCFWKQNQLVISIPSISKQGAYPVFSCAVMPSSTTPDLLAVCGGETPKVSPSPILGMRDSMPSSCLRVPPSAINSTTAAFDTNKVNW
eukprot:CAMPEP_0204854002 /NCGR_PEP_ID=MMETSP1347-20130617/14433_1 /ASSEMBLY_ACC=CAM_ASM_000690 /TAXON_ID=215587 /ORGANISM="Aplanochytrium stocchinoi, Strain GSBS06" /LENGTH=166 /DNA_ID=CAMNT_0051999325 /DNA_START=351 /DNA_END=848 /DNA_ORIENTATION=-